MAYELKLVADTKEEAEDLAKKALKEIDYVCQPHVTSLIERDDGKWVCTIKYWGYD